MPLQASLPKVPTEEVEIILCRGMALCETPRAWPCEFCVRIDPGESWMIEETIATLPRETANR
ncbi:MAG: hypothetical protein WA884_14605 [Methyloceanibacter sp.]